MEITFTRHVRLIKGRKLFHRLQIFSNISNLQQLTTFYNFVLGPFSSSKYIICYTAQKMKFSIKLFLSNCDQSHSFL